MKFILSSLEYSNFPYVFSEICNRVKKKEKEKEKGENIVKLHKTDQIKFNPPGWQCRVEFD